MYPLRIVTERIRPIGDLERPELVFPLGDDKKFDIQANRSHAENWHLSVTTCPFADIFFELIASTVPGICGDASRWLRGAFNFQKQGLVYLHSVYRCHYEIDATKFSFCGVRLALYAKFVFDIEVTTQNLSPYVVHAFLEAVRCDSVHVKPDQPIVIVFFLVSDHQYNTLSMKDDNGRYPNRVCHGWKCLSNFSVRRRLVVTK